MGRRSEPLEGRRTGPGLVLTASFGVPVLLVLIPRLLLAQTAVTGTVTGDSLRPVSGALISIAGFADSAVRSDPRGRFRLVGERGGKFTVTVRALGFSTASRAIDVAAGGTTDLSIQLEPVPQQLDPVTVETSPPLPTGIMRGFEERRRMGLGRFLTRDQLEAREHDSVGDIMRGIAGVRMVQRPTACGGGFAASSGRGIATVEFGPSKGSNTSQVSYTCGGAAMPVACYMSVYLDGIRIWAPGMPDPPDFTALHNNMFEGVEIYRGASEVPAQYGGTGSACGAVLLWNRVGGGNWSGLQQ